MRCSNFSYAAKSECWCALPGPAGGDYSIPQTRETTNGFSGEERLGGKESGSILEERGMEGKKWGTLCHFFSVFRGIPLGSLYVYIATNKSVMC